jgi:thymidylate synthase (FAD)
MQVIKPSVEILSTQSGMEILQMIEKAGRTCYKSEDKITEDSCIKFVENLINRDHTAMIEFGDVTARFICDRGVTHEIVRHRLFSFAQESTRYCNYAKRKDLGNELTFIKPCFWPDENEVGVDSNYFDWKDVMEDIEKAYLHMIEHGATAQEARSILPNSLKTEIVIKGNLREWVHFFKLRTAPAAHPQMQEVAKMALQQFKEYIPIVFDKL